MNVKQLLGAITAMILKVALAAVIIAVVFRTAIAAYDFGFQVFADIAVAQEGEGRTVNVTITSEQDVRDVGKMLEDKGLIQNTMSFYVQVLLLESDVEIQPGSYELNTEMNVETMLHIMCSTETTEMQ